MTSVISLAVVAHVQLDIQDLCAILLDIETMVPRRGGVESRHAQESGNMAEITTVEDSLVLRYRDRARTSDAGITAVQ